MSLGEELHALAANFRCSTSFTHVAQLADTLDGRANEAERRLPPNGFLTDAELRAMDLTCDLVNVMCKQVIGRGPTRDHDVSEFVSHIHVIQAAILSQAAGRAYPDRFRTLGETLR